MSKMIIVSDSHGLVEPLEKIYAHFKDEVDYFVHCGDSELKADHPLFQVYEGVKGNCDFATFPEILKIDVAGHTILVTHGHLYKARSTLNQMYYLAVKEGADVVCFGHNHVPLNEEIEGVLFINPGSVRHNRGILRRIPECFALLDLASEKPIVKFYDVKTFGEISIE